MDASVLAPAFHSHHSDLVSLNCNTSKIAVFSLGPGFSRFQVRLDVSNSWPLFGVKMKSLFIIESSVSNTAKFRCIHTSVRMMLA